MTGPDRQDPFPSLRATDDPASPRAELPPVPREHSPVFWIVAGAVLLAAALFVLPAALLG